jgi:2-dehydropantoate 2-reductase
LRIGIIGAGAVGCLFGGLLGIAGSEVTLVHRNPLVVSIIRKKGVKIQENSRRTVTARVSAKLAPADLTREDLVILAVKAYDTKQAAILHRHRVRTQTSILTLQNGLGNIETLTRIFGKRAVLGGTTTEASLLLGPGHVTHAGSGETRIGEIGKTISTRCSLIAGEFRRAGFKTTVTKNPRGAIWAKAIINAAINPASALLRVPNGTLASEPAILQAMMGVLREGVAVSKAELVRIDPPHPVVLLKRVLRATAANRSSMLQDLEQGRTSEIRHLNGAIVALGRKHGIPTPLNQLLVSLISTAEGLSTTRQAAR